MLMQPLGLLYLASYIRRHGDVDVRVIDMAPDRMRYDDLPEQIRSCRPDLIGVSALTFESQGLHRIAAIARGIDPGITVTAGGAHPTAYTREVMQDRNIDFAVLGEGELTLDALLRALRTGAPAAGIDGLASRLNGEVRTVPRRRYVRDLDSLPFPAWDLIDLSRYRSFDRMSRCGTGRYMVLFSTRGCPFECLYCHKVFGKEFRKRSPENVLAEIRALYTRHGVREFEVVDDIFNCDLPRAKRIFQMIADSGMDITLTFPNGVRGDRLDDEFLAKARRAGTVFMSFAVETATPRLQKMLRKNIDLQKISRNIALARKNGIMCLGFFMLGFPTETREELQATIDFAVRSDLHAATMFVVNPFEGTGLADLARTMGKPVLSSFDENYLTRGCTNMTDLPDRELLRIRRKGLLRFWLRPSRIAALVRDYPCPSRLPALLGVLLRRMLFRA